MKLNPYEIYGGALGTMDPVLLNISGGRTSGYMLYHILVAYSGVLPPQVHPVFTNTGREFDETLDFLTAMELRWGVHITWLERRFDNGAEFEVVGHNSAAKNGEPFDALIKSKGYLPNAVTRFCTVELKIRAAAKWMKAQGYERWCSVTGYRADEAHRLLRAEKRDALKKDPWYTLAPMVDAGVTKRDVAAFWKAQPFDLNLPNVNGKTPLGNCDGCFLKSQAILAGIARDHPGRFKWWTDHESRLIGKAAAATFRPPVKRTHTDLADFACRQGDMISDLSDAPEGIDCFCTGD